MYSLLCLLSKAVVPFGNFLLLQVKKKSANCTINAYIEHCSGL